jgi:YD repeat-containing protein
VQDGAGNVTANAYDGAGRNTRTTLPDNSYSTTTFDLADRPTTTASYNAAGTKLREQTTRYDRADNVVATVDPKLHTTTYRYDANNALIAQTQPISASDTIDTTFGYDLNGNRTRFTDGRSNAFFTTYNTWGMPESQIEPATSAHPNAADRTFTVAYDKAGRPSKQTLPGGVTITNAFDDIGQLTTQTGQGAEAATEDRTFGYDLAGRITALSGTGGVSSLTYDDRNLLRSITGPSGNSSFTYNDDGYMASRADAAGATTYGVGAVACMVGAGALINLAKDTAQGDIHSLSDALGSAGMGALRPSRWSWWSHHQPRRHRHHRPPRHRSRRERRRGRRQPGRHHPHRRPEKRVRPPDQQRNFSIGGAKPRPGRCPQSSVCDLQRSNEEPGGSQRQGTHQDVGRRHGPPHHHRQDKHRPRSSAWTTTSGTRRTTRPSSSRSA